MGNDDYGAGRCLRAVREVDADNNYAHHSSSVSSSQLRAESTSRRVDVLECVGGVRIRSRLRELD